MEECEDNCDNQTHNALKHDISLKQTPTQIQI